MTKMAKYWLDPDFRRDPPRYKDGSFKPHCVRCQKGIKNLDNALPVIVEWDSWLVEEDNGQKVDNTTTYRGLIGKDCWHKITEGTQND